MTDFASTFRRSHKGNLTRELPDEVQLTVFSRWDKYSWSIRYSDGNLEYGQRYDTEEEALEGLEYHAGFMFNLD